MTRHSSFIRHPLFALVALMLAVAGCGGSSSPTTPSPSGGSSGNPSPSPTPTPTPTPGPSPNGTITATIDGAAWSAGGASVQTTFNNGILAFAGADSSQSLSIAITANRGPGTDTTGVIDPQNVVVTLLSNVATQAAWQSGPTFGSGSVTLTTLTSSSASGTFSLTLAPTPAPDRQETKLSRMGPST